MERERLQAIQILRGIAAMGVVVHHIFMTMRDHPGLVRAGYFPQLPGLANFGATGVDLFFIISGFIMADVVSRRTHAGAGRFLADRAIRILPMFWLASAVYIGWMLWRGASFPPGAYINSVLPVTWDADGGYRFPALYAGWTLAFELAFYALAAIIIVVRPTRPDRVLLLSLALLAIAGSFSAFHARAPIVFNPIMGEFALGLLVWMSWRDRWRWISRNSLTVGAMLLLLLIVTPWSITISVHPEGVVSGTASSSRLLFPGVPYALIVAGAVRCGEAYGRLPRFFERAGNASYSLYLVHPIVLEVARATLPDDARANPEMLAVALLITSIVVSLRVYVLIERPMLGTLKRLRTGIERTLARRSRNDVICEPRA